jgi:hypothetical protein
MSEMPDLPMTVTADQVAEAYAALGIPTMYVRSITICFDGIQVEQIRKRLNDEGRAVSMLAHGQRIATVVTDIEVKR